MARIHATNAIRKHNEAINFMRLAGRLDAVASQIGSAAIMQGTVNKTMSSVVSGLDKVLATDNVEQMSLMMDQFESQVGMLNTQSAYMESTMNGTSGLTTPVDQVDELIQQVADQHQINVNTQLKASAAPSGLSADKTPSVANDELTERLNALRSNRA